jgi:hypothetical protein
MKILSPINAEKILSNGKILDAWPCDVNSKGELESNGGDEMLVEKDGKFHILTGKYNRLTNSGILYPGVFGGHRQVELNELSKDILDRLPNRSNDQGK